MFGNPVVIGPAKINLVGTGRTNTFDDKSRLAAENKITHDFIAQIIFNNDPIDKIGNIRARNGHVICHEPRDIREGKELSCLVLKFDNQFGYECCMI